MGSIFLLIAYFVGVYTLAATMTKFILKLVYRREIIALCRQHANSLEGVSKN
jgi:hypothetical protein